MAHHDQLDNRLHYAAQKQLRLIKITLLVILIGLSVVERRIAAWPIMTWPMYSTRTTPFPPPSASGIELRVILSTTGGVQKLTEVDFFPMGRTRVAERAMRSAFDDADPTLRAAYRTYLVKVIHRILHADEVDTIEGWRLEWAVDPLALPPLDRARPVREVRLGSFSASHYIGATRNKP
jgi:hypothetical protein